MSLNDYQREAARTAASVDHDTLVVAALGLAGETGEFVELIKKHFFHGKAFDREAVKKELGDVLWYLALAASAAELSLDTIAAANIEKLRARYPDGFVPGGGNREDDGS